MDVYRCNEKINRVDWIVWEKHINIKPIESDNDHLEKKCGKYIRKLKRLKDEQWKKYENIKSKIKMTHSDNIETIWENEFHNKRRLINSQHERKIW